MQTITLNNNINTAMNMLEEILNSERQDSVLKILKAYKSNRKLDKETLELLSKVFCK